MAKHDIKVNEITVQDGVPTVHGTVGSETFTAAPFRWGSKMLMKVEAAGLDRGTRIAIGHKAKSAIKAAGLTLPEAKLVRPRKPKAEVVEAAPAKLEGEPVPSGEFLELTDLVGQLDAAVGA